MIASLQTTLVICTHQLHGLEDLCEDAGLLMRGEMVARGSIAGMIAERWPGRRVTVALGEAGPTGASAAALVTGAVSGAGAGVSPDGSLDLELADDTAVEAAVAGLAAGGAAIRAVVPVTHTLGDLYFDVIQSQREHGQ